MAETAQSEGDDLVLAHALRHISDIARETGANDEALTAGRAALSIYLSRSQSFPLDIANAHRVTALALMGAEAFDDAALHWEQARALYAKDGVHAGVQECDANLNLRTRTR